MKTMAVNTAAERLRWIKPILDKDLTVAKMATISPLFRKDP